MKKTIAILTPIFSFVFIIAVGVYLLSSFSKGGYSYLCSSVFPDNISVKGGSVKIDGITGNSALTFRDYEYYFEDNKLYIKLRYGLHSKDYPNASFYIDINEDNARKVEGIYFTNGKIKKPVWSTKYTVKSTMNDDREKFEKAEKILLEKLEYLALENNSKLRVCYEYSIISNDEKDTYMLLPIQRLSDSAIISNYLLNIKTSEIYEGNFDIEYMELIFNKKIN